VTNVIELRGLRCVAICGVLDEERTRPQPLRLDLDVEAQLDVAGRSDQLNDTVDYAAVCTASLGALDAGKPQLLEAACELVGRAVLGVDTRIEAVTVTVAKLRPPVACDLETVGVRRRIAR
jgi:7,8-dihydroneopterin aldolase/epimerase/oxygenase